MGNGNIPKRGNQLFLTVNVSILVAVNFLVVVLCHSFFLFICFFVTIAICDPPCQNSGTCVGFNVCQCSQNYKGSRCEYGNVVMNYSLELGEYLCVLLWSSRVSSVCVLLLPFYLLLMIGCSRKLGCFGSNFCKISFWKPWLMKDYSMYHKMGGIGKELTRTWINDTCVLTTFNFMTDGCDIVNIALFYLVWFGENSRSWVMIKIVVLSVHRSVACLNGSINRWSCCRNFVVLMNIDVLESLNSLTSFNARLVLHRNVPWYKY